MIGDPYGFDIFFRENRLFPGYIEIGSIVNENIEIPISLGIFLWYPLLQELKEKGMRDALIATFLYSRAVKIPLLPVMVLYFGVKLVVVLTILMVLFSIIDVILVEKINKLGRD
jgi:uncharacterized membrane protein YraQ (UPF0718 family)